MTKGIAGEDMDAGMAIYRGPDGKWYRAAKQGYEGVAAEAIKAGYQITDEGDRDGYFKAVKK
ncbi:hypothetical protein ACVWZK_006426 [Bradyrhizobium sp. GM0.4]